MPYYQVLELPVVELCLALKGPVKLAAVFKEQKLVELVATRETDGIIGRIYAGKVERVVSGLQAAFVNIGGDKAAYLQAVDVPLCQLKGEKRDIATVLYPGMIILVQVIRESFGEKGPRVSMDLALASSLAVYRPLGNGISFSKSISNPNLKETLVAKLSSPLTSPLKGGVTVRTQAQDVAPENVVSEVNYLQASWQRAQSKHDGLYLGEIWSPNDFKAQIASLKNVWAPQVIVSDEDLAPEEISVLNSNASCGASDILNNNVLAQVRGNDFAAIFPRFVAEINKLLARKVTLPCGGEIIIDETEALTVIDVDSSAFVGAGKNRANDVALKTNLEAATIIARELKLRNIGGAIIIDFINLADKKSQAMVLARLNEALAQDKTSSICFGFTKLGLVEISRKRQAPSIKQLLTTNCLYCGAGVMPNKFWQVCNMRAEILALIQTSRKPKALKVCCDLETAELYQSIYGKHNLNIEWVLSPNQPKATGYEVLMA